MLAPSPGDEPQARIGENQAGLKQPAPKNAGPVNESANSAPVPAEPAKSAGTKPKDVAPSSEARNDKSPHPPLETAKKEEKPPPEIRTTCLIRTSATSTLGPAYGTNERPLAADRGRKKVAPLRRPFPTLFQQAARPTARRPAGLMAGCSAAVLIGQIGWGARLGVAAGWLSQKPFGRL